MAEEKGGEGGAWSEYRRLVIHELTRIDKRIGETHDTMEERFAEMQKGMAHMSNEITTLKVKAGLWGAAAGVVVSSTFGIAIKKFFGG